MTSMFRHRLRLVVQLNFVARIKLRLMPQALRSAGKTGESLVVIRYEQHPPTKSLDERVAMGRSWC